MKEAAPAWCSLCFTSIKTLRRRLYTLVLANGKLTDQEISVISGMPLEEIQKLRTQR